MKAFQDLRTRHLRVGLLAGVACLAYAAPAMAQDAQDAVPEIVVTAQARNESAQSVPISVAVVGGADIEKTSITNLSEMTAQLPSVKITEAAAGDQLFIRGVGSGLNPGFEQSVGTFIDGIYYGRGRQSSGQMLDVERVEVLKGPQSIYFGNNTIGGALNIATRKPGDELEGFFQGMHEFNADEWDAQGAVTLPITQQASVRLAGRYNDLGGWLDNTLLNRKEMQRRSYSFRSTFGLFPTENFTAYIKAEVGHLYELGNLYEAVDCPGVLGVASPPNCAQAVAHAGTTGFEDKFDLKKQDGSLGPYASPLFDPANKFHRQNSFDTSANLQWKMPGGQTLTSVTGFTWYKDYRNNIDNDFTPNDIFVVPRREKYSQFSQELRLTSPTNVPVEYVVGAYYQDAALDMLDQFSTTLAGGASPHTRDHQDQRVLSGFGALTWNITQAIRVVGGLRYTKVHKTDRHSVQFFELDGVTPLNPTSSAALNTAFGFYESPVQHFRRTDHDLTPSINLQWDVAPRVMAYASYVEGFKAGGFDALIRANPANAAAFADAISFNPEKAKAYEAGIKSKFTGGKVLLNLAYFRSDYTNLQVSTFDGTAGFLVGNAGKAKSQGVDGELRFAASDRLSLGLAATYLNAKYVSFTTAQCRYIDPRPNPDLPGACIQSGERLTYAPKWSGSANASYHAPLTDKLELRLNGTVNFTSGFFTASDDDPYTLQKGFAKIDARIAIGSIEKGWELALIGKNLTDKLTTSQSNDMPLANGSYFKSVDRPRSIALQFGYKF